MPPARPSISTAIRLAVLAATALLAGVLLGACGGDSGGDENPQQVLEETFAPGKDYSQGVIDVGFDLSNDSDPAGKIDAELKGPYQGSAGSFPKFALDTNVSTDLDGQESSFEGTLISGGDAGFVSFQGVDYKLDDPTFKALADLLGSIEPGGLDPVSVLTDLENEGSEDVEGAESIHIAAKVDVNKLIDQVQGAQQGRKQSGQSEQALEQAREGIKTFNVDIYSGEEDKRLRKVDANIIITPPAETTGGEETTINVQFSLTFSELGEPQTITAPTSSQPFNALLEQFAGAAGGIGQALGGGSGGGAGATGDGAGAAVPEAPTGEESSGYLQCLSQAKGEAELQACAEAAQ